MPIDAVRGERVDAIQSALSTEDYDLMTLAHMLVTYKISLLESEFEKETEILADRQKRLEFLNKVHRLYNSSLVDDRGGMELTGSEYDALLQEAKEMQAEMLNRRERAAELEAQIAALQADGVDENSDAVRELKREVAALRQGADEMEDTLNASALLNQEKTKFSRDERDRMIDNVRTQDKLLKAQNSYQSQMIQRLQSERLEYINIGKDIMNKLHDAKKRMASNFR